MLLFALMASQMVAVPYFARKYNVRCAQCHLLPPTLNEFGQRFVANGYKLDELKVEGRTVPIAAWITHRAEIDEVNDRAKAYPNRVELISSDALTPWFSYFVEWRTLSYQTTASQRLLSRHGRFEDVFVQFWLPKRVTLTVGQFRMLNQWDVSRRLTLSEPLAYSASVPGLPSNDARLNSLRAFSLAGRAPAIRATFQAFGGGSESDGWFHELVLPFSGELSAPLGNEARRNASFALEARPKGFLYETYYRKGISSVGGAVFASDDRWLSNVTGALQAGRHSLLATVGTAKFRRGYNDLRISIGDTWIPRAWFGAGARLDHQSALRRRPAVLPHVNFSFPGTKYTVLLTVEQRIQQRAHGTTVEFGVVF
ncbi:MAG: hypothetical protein WD696_17280 [Bryobacteraceae bacterium]